MIRPLALAACLLIAGCGSLTSTTAEQPAEAAPVAEAPPAADYLVHGKQQGYEAAVAAQSAGESEWASVAEKWGWAINSLGLVPVDHPDYAEAQAKATEYAANRDVAYQRDATYQAKVEAAAAPSVSSSGGGSTIDAFRSELSLIDPDGTVITGVAETEPPLDCPACIDIGVSTAFLSQNKAVRLELATHLWKGWAIASSPNDPDKARIRLVTQSGKKVGGSGMMGGSMVYVDD
ncbi:MULTISPECIES: hypothetical protein [Cyanophyceae]|uniref:Lipoprotein n=1 Tax=Leptolyngbya subtilissima DQ-A4 TaxID=2933933 RepID=A0ABV0KC15_9CYAN|nr:hypothetical protein [Nodosilinea sp. FACHB-141]MBD2111734.1 hypothetical protein [Nodosilinea sp. FACHB-141]